MKAEATVADIVARLCVAMENAPVSPDDWIKWASRSDSITLVCESGRRFRVTVTSDWPEQ